MIDILMATYNGDKYLEEQLDSIFNQSFKDWHLIIADDCSNDRTVSILEKYKLMYPDKVTYYINKLPSGSAKNNFYQLMDKSKSEYVMFADQDDVWLNNKIMLTMELMHKAEDVNGKETPLLVHTDLCVVDQNLNIIDKSIFTMQKMDCKRDKLNNLLVSNIVTGCTMMVNRSLMCLLEEKPQNSVMHDMWLGLVASAFGKIYFVDEATILYRQHGNNSNGVKNFASLKFLMSGLQKTSLIHEGLISQYNQAFDFLKIYKNKLNIKQIRMLAIFSDFPNMNFFEKIIILNRYNLYKTGLVRILTQLLF